MSTAVWMVMCSEPVMRAPARGCSGPYRSRIAMRPGISCSASSISLRPNSARDGSATLKSGRSVDGLVGAVVVMGLLRVLGRTGRAALAGSRPGSPGDSSRKPDRVAG